MKITPLALIASMLLATPAGAQEPENQIKYRQAVMSAIGGHTGAASQIVRGNVVAEGALLIHAEALAALTRDIPHLFPEGSDLGETKAKPTIWEQWDKFTEASAKARTATDGFLAAVKHGDPQAIGAAFRQVGDSCKGCHDDFRLED
jgi:cytochrome c556